MKVLLLLLNILQIRGSPEHLIQNTKEYSRKKYDRKKGFWKW